MKVYVEIFDLDTDPSRKLVSHYKEADTMKGEYINRHEVVKKALADLKKDNILSQRLWCQVYEAMNENVLVSNGTLEDFEEKGLNCLTTVVLDKKQVDKLQELLS